MAHKTGSVERLFHDAAVVYPEGASPYVLVVLTAGLEERVAAPALVAGIAREVHAVLAGRGGDDAAWVSPGPAPARSDPAPRDLRPIVRTRRAPGPAGPRAR